MMAELRDYEQWHRSYDDPASGHSWRLREVQRAINGAFDRGATRVLSSCAGDGRDVLGVLAERPDRDRITATLVELLPVLTERAREHAAAAGLSGIEVRTADAGQSDAYAGAVPADVVLLVGIFGNISPADIERTIRAAPQLCNPGATLLWTRGRRPTDISDEIRGWFTETGFTELDYLTFDGDSYPTLGVQRFDGTPQPLEPGRQLFTFIR
jgi:hypothetical protein